MIKRKDDQWTTIQCKNLVGDNGEICNLCFKILNDRFALTQQCPYCLGKISMLKEAKAADAIGKTEIGPIRKQYPKVRKEDTVGHQLAQEKVVPKRHTLREDG